MTIESLQSLLHDNSFRKDVSRVAAFAAPYALASVLAFHFRAVNETIIAVWPASGVGLAALLMTRRKLWPVVVTALFLGGYVPDLFVGRSAVTSAGFMVVNLLGSFISASLILRICNREEITFSTTKQLMALAAAALLVTANTAVLAAGIDALVNHTAFSQTWLTWWISDGLGMLLVTPLFYWRSMSRNGKSKWATIESGFFLALWLGAVYVVFQRPWPQLSVMLPRPYMLMGLLIWPAFRLGQRMLTVSLALLAAISLAIVAGAPAPEQTPPLAFHFATIKSVDDLLITQVFVAFAALASMLLAASVTEKKLSVDKLRESEERLRLLGDNLPDNFVYQLTRDQGGNTRVLYVSAGVEQVQGISREEVLKDGDLLCAYLHPEDSAAFHEAKRVSAVELSVFDQEFRWILPDQRVRWLRAQSRPRLAEDGQVVWDGVTTDVTNHKLADEAIRESRQQLQVALDAAHLGTWSCDLGTGKTVLSQQSRRILGFGAEETCSHEKMLDRVVPEDRAPFNDWLTRGIAKNQQNVEYRVQREDGIRWLSSRGSATTDDEGKVLRATGVVVDVSDLTTAAERMRSLEDQLHEAQKMEAIGRLAGGVAHDFNNLLMVINTYAELMHELLSPEDRLRRNTQEILNACNRAAGLTSQLLAFSRKQIAVQVPLDLNSVVQETSKMLGRLVGEDVELRIRAESSLGVIKADSGQLVQILMNLCVNARDAMPRGGVITITTSNVSYGENERPADLPPGDFVVLSVSDTGVGMTKEVLEHIFEPFYTTKPVGKGTGLGLATVYGIVKQNGGSVWVNSHPGQGTSFTVCLPQVQESIMSTELAEAETAQRGTETLLVAEDEEALRESLCEHLVGLGYSVLAASSGHEAVSLAAEHDGPIAVLITDVVMPKMSGRELSKTLTSLRPDLKTIYMTGYTDDSVLRHGISEAGVALLQKPFSMSRLARKVRELVGSTAQ